MHSTKRMKLLQLSLISCFILWEWKNVQSQSLIEDADLLIKCEPKKIRQYWTKNYNLSDKNWIGDFIKHYKLYDFNTKIRKDKNMWRSLEHNMLMYKTGGRRLFRLSKELRFYNFHLGHALNVYQIDPDTKKLSVTSLGFHTIKFFKAVEKGKWIASSLEETEEDVSALVGVTLFPDPSEIRTPVPKAKRSKMLKRFPEHADVIKKFTLSD